MAGVVARTHRRAPEGIRLLVTVLAWPVLATVVAAGLAVLYRFAPDRKQARWRWISGATLATLLWLATSIALFAYVQGLGNYETTYGSLAGVAISMFWLWITVFLVIAGATINAEAERQDPARLDGRARSRWAGGVPSSPTAPRRTPPGGSSGHEKSAGVNARGSTSTSQLPETSRITASTP